MERIAECHRSNESSRAMPSGSRTRRQSYRNRFIASYQPGGDYDQWSAMADAGLAERARVMTGPDERQTARFWLTEAGARTALDPGETLCPEDFPPLPPRPAP